MLDPRRRAFLASGLAGAGLTLVGRAFAQDKGRDEPKEKETTANEDLMREHGVLRRAIMVYEVTAARLRGRAGAFDPQLLLQTAQLFRQFGEDYHERKLEEAYIFPQVERYVGEAASLVPILKAQHDRGRAITDYIVARVRTWNGGDAARLAGALDAFNHMYRAHTAREDTIVFPAWKKSLSGHQYEELGDKFEEIERQTFGHDGFDDAVTRVGAIELGLGIADLAGFTAPEPPKA